MDWQPIDTAPRDGTEILLWAMHWRDWPDLTKGYPIVVIPHVEYDHEDWTKYTWKQRRGELWYNITGPFWMPLPTSPSASLVALPESASALTSVGD